MKMRKRISNLSKKKKIQIILVAVVVMLIASASGYAFARQSLVDYFFPKTDLRTEKDVVNHEKQKIVIDDYTITLEESLCEKNTGMEHYVMSVTKEKGTLEAKLNNKELVQGFGEDNRFDIGICVSCGQTLDVEKEGNTLYLYLEINRVLGEKDNSMENSFCIVDYKYQDDTTMSGYKEYYFDLLTDEESLECQTDQNQTVYVSTSGVTITSGQEYTLKQLSFIMKDGTEKKVLDEKNCYEKMLSEPAPEYHPEKYVYQIGFKELLDYNKIKEIVVNNKKYSVND